jgi:hypothetical protein
MNKRWKYQIMTGGFWAIFMIVLSTFFVENTPFQEQMKTQLFWIKFFSYFAFGIFVLGYVSWKAKLKREGIK